MKCMAAEDSASVQGAFQAVSIKEAKEKQETGHKHQHRMTLLVQTVRLRSQISQEDNKV